MNIFLNQKFATFDGTGFFPNPDNSSELLTLRTVLISTLRHVDPERPVYMSNDEHVKILVWMKLLARPDFESIELDPDIDKMIKLKISRKWLASEIVAQALDMMNGVVADKTVEIESL